MKSHKLRNQTGFSLVELMLVVALIGIIAVISIPVIIEYRRKTFDTRAKSDLSSLATAEESYYSNNERYLTCADLTCETGLPSFKRSAGVSISASGNTASFSASADHQNGTRSFSWDSAIGGMQP